MKATKERITYLIDLKMAHIAGKKEIHELLTILKTSEGGKCFFTYQLKTDPYFNLDCVDLERELKKIHHDSSFSSVMDSILNKWRQYNKNLLAWIQSVCR